VRGRLNIEGSGVVEMKGKVRGSGFKGGVKEREPE